MNPDVLSYMLTALAIIAVAVSTASVILEQRRRTRLLRERIREALTVPCLRCEGPMRLTGFEMTRTKAGVSTSASAECPNCDRLATPAPAGHETLADEIEARYILDPADDEWDQAYNTAVRDIGRYLRGDRRPGLDRVHDAIRQARGGDAPPQFRGYA